VGTGVIEQRNQSGRLPSWPPGEELFRSTNHQRAREHISLKGAADNATMGHKTKKGGGLYSQEASREGGGLRQKDAGVSGVNRRKRCGGRL